MIAVVYSVFFVSGWGKMKAPGELLADMVF